MQEHPFATIDGVGVITARVQRVCDGDTLGVDWQPAFTLNQRMRLADVDASGRGRPGWTEATELLRDYVKTERLDLEWAYDRPGRPCNCNRPLIYLWHGSTLINAEIIRSGYARVHRRFTDTRHYATCLAAEAQARDERRGLWKHIVLPKESG